MKRAVIAVAALIVLGACVRRATLTTPQLAQLRTAQSLAVLAETNRGIALTAVALNKSGHLSDAVTRATLDYCYEVGNAVTTGFAILNSNRAQARKTAELVAVMLLDRLNPPASLLALINDPRAPVAVQGIIASIRASALLIQDLRRQP